MILLRLASLVAATVTIILNATYGYKTSTIFEYAILFATLNAALDLAKCTCLLGARLAWQSGRHVAACLLIVLFWPLLANSLWCGLSEVATTRAAEQLRYQADAQLRSHTSAELDRLTNTIAVLEANPLFASSAACTLPKSERARALCTQYRTTEVALATLRADLTSEVISDPAPQLSLLAQWTGVALPALQLAASFWPIALSELCGSLGFYLSAAKSQDRTQRSLRALWPRRQAPPAPPPQNTPEAVPEPSPASSAPAIRWPALSAE